MTDPDRVFWLAIREGLMILIRAIEQRFLPDLKKPFQ